MEIQWFNEKPKDCVVTIAAGNITLNKPATHFFENAYSVMLGIEKSHQLLIIKPLLKAEAIRHDIPDSNKYRISVRSSYSRIANKAFIEEVSTFLDQTFENSSKRFKATWQHKDQILVVDLKEEL